MRYWEESPHKIVKWLRYLIGSTRTAHGGKLIGPALTMRLTRLIAGLGCQPGRIWIVK